MWGKLEVGMGGGLGMGETGTGNERKFPSRSGPPAASVCRAEPEREGAGAHGAGEARLAEHRGRFSKPGHCPTRHPAPSSYMRTWEHNAGNFMPSPSRTEASLSQTRTLRPRRERYKDIKSLEYFQRWVTAVFPNCGLLLGFHPGPA